MGWDGIGWDDVRQLRFSGFEEAEEFNYKINDWDKGRHYLIISYQNEICMMSKLVMTGINYSHKSDERTSRYLPIKAVRWCRKRLVFLYGM